MDNLIPDNEYTEVEGRLYANPQVSIDETNTFIDNLRSTQGRQNQEILQQTQMLGTDVPSNLGGLTGAESYFTSRYQTPQTNSVVANLRATAQAAALNQALENEQAMWKKRYQDAYRAYQKRAWNNQNKTTTTTDNTPDNISSDETTVEISDITTEGLAMSRYQKLLNKYIQAGYPTDVAEQKAKEDFGKSVDVDAPVDRYPYNRRKSTVGGNNAYIYTLPNGNTVLVEEDKYELVQTGGGYALKNKETGELMQVGE